MSEVGCLYTNITIYSLTPLRWAIPAYTKMCSHIFFQEGYISDIRQCGACTCIYMFMNSTWLWWTSRMLYPKRPAIQPQKPFQGYYIRTYMHPPSLPLSTSIYIVCIVVWPALRSYQVRLCVESGSKIRSRMPGMYMFLYICARKCIYTDTSLRWAMQTHIYVYMHMCVYQQEVSVFIYVLCYSW